MSSGYNKFDLIKACHFVVDKKEDAPFVLVHGDTLELTWSINIDGSADDGSIVVTSGNGIGKTSVTIPPGESQEFTHVLNGTCPDIVEAARSIGYKLVRIPLLKHFDPIECDECGVTFTPIRRDQRFHTKQCKDRWHQRSYRAAKKEVGS